jgi:RsiW-degrading membrane proteinase PrsW (M82 family)
MNVWILAFAISAVSFVIFRFVYRVKWRYLVLGVVPFFIARYVETYMLTPSDLILMLIFIAPVWEEILKFLFTFFRKTFDGGIAVGLTFAWIENAFYYVTYFHTSLFLFVVLIREFTDPVLHSTTTSISQKSWQGKFRYLGIAILLHAMWNTVAVVGTMYEILSVAVIYFGITYYRYRKIRKQNIIK